MNVDILTLNNHVSIGKVTWIPGIEKWGSVIKSKTFTDYKGNKDVYRQINFNNSINVLKDLKSIYWYNSKNQPVIFQLSKENNPLETKYQTCDLLDALLRAKKYSLIISVLTSTI